MSVSGVATVGHGWARAHPTLARVGHQICTNSNSFLGEVRWGGSRLRMSLKVYSVYLLWTHHENAFVHCRLYICISGFWGFCPQIPTGAMPLDPTGGLPSADLRAHPTSKPWLCHWCQ